MIQTLVFCSSSDKINPIFFHSMKDLAEGLVQRNRMVLFGGENLGLMGCLAQTVIENQGQIVGLLPEIFNTPETQFDRLTEKVVFPHLADRKKAMLDRADEVIVFPGGLGTLDEALEVITLKAIGVFQGDIYFVNILDFWVPFFDFLFELKLRGMISSELSHLYEVVSSPKDLWVYLDSENSESEAGESL
ncbi:MAG: TIGR00730 family Rossman fold protein [Bdellovibrionales bacterium]|nr:TIGR00730 family Rossman fold protein [Bdellovibrionales bacterium]